MVEANGLGLPGLGYGLPPSKAVTHTNGPLNNYKPTDAGLHQETSVFSHIGGRKAQEDRFCISHKLGEPEGIKKVSFYGVFDGTVGDFASDTVKDLVIPALESTEGFKKFLASQNGKNSITMQTLKGNETVSIPDNVVNGAGKTEEEQVQIAAWQEECMRASMRHMYLMADEELIRRAGIEEYHRREKPQHYAASTSVTLMLWNDLVCVGHLGDSRICLMYITDDQLRKLQRSKGISDDKKTPIPTREVGEEMVQGNFVTQDHKPDQPDERQRIEQCGGSVEYLHNHQNKPFIRGGDFQQRKILGESPMQL